jgi:hypothetical protein
LISVSVAPGSYFFWARAPLQVAASNTKAAGIVPSRICFMDMFVSLIVNVSYGCFYWKLSGFCLDSIPFAGDRQEKAPAGRGSRLVI